MATRAATFTAKIGNLKDYHNRLLHGTAPIPSGMDMANTLKYFSQTLLSVLKDVPFIPSENYGPRQRDSIRLSMFPNLNYSGLYEAVLNIIEVVPMVQHGQDPLGESILNALGCLVPFLEHELLDMLPYTVASMLAVFPSSLQKETVQLLCTNLLPVTFGYESMNESQTYATESTAALLMLVFQYVENGEYHSQLLECLMSRKKNIIKDLLSVIAYGPLAAKAPAVNHLFHYWPQLNPSPSDTRPINYKYMGWEPVSCQREKCLNSGNVKAVKMCLDPGIAIENADRPPPLYICVDCVDQLRQEHVQFLVDILQPMETVSLTCEHKNCASRNKTAMCTCFSIECASLNGFRPMRYCSQCHSLKHETDTGSSHIFHLSIPDVWSCEPELKGCLMEAIVSLLREAIPLEDKRQVEMGEERIRGLSYHDYDHHDYEDSSDDVYDERKLLSRYGVWLLVELVSPRDDISLAVLGRILAMLFHWYDATAYLPDDNVGNSLEKLKPEYVTNWLRDTRGRHFEVLLSCLLPHPPEYAKVGGYWDTLSSRTSQIKEGLNRLFCLIPYDIVNYEVWDYVMPFWLEAIRTEVPNKERDELKVLLCKLFDTDMSPLPFSLDKMYHFISERFEGTDTAVQEQNLSWLQILSSLDILIPVNLLLGMFKTGVDSLSNLPEDEAVKPAVAPPTSPPPSMPGSGEKKTAFPFEEEEESPPVAATNLSCFVMMLDIVAVQLELQNAPSHRGVLDETSCEIMDVVARMVHTPWRVKHACEEESDGTGPQQCEGCLLASLWHQMTSSVLAYVMPEKAIPLPVKDLPKVEEINYKKESSDRAAKEKSQNGESKAVSPEAEPEPEPAYDVTSLPMHLQLILALLKELETESDADALFFLLNTMKLLCLHGEALNECVPQHEEVVKYSLRSSILPNLWKLLQAEHSQIASVAVPLLLHCLMLPSGADVFWKLIEDNFNNETWQARFAAVEKVTMLARLTNIKMIESNQQIMTSLAHAFCYLIGSLNDINSAVVQRTTLYLETVKDSSIRCVCHCLEFQFDSVINDRTMLLHKMYLLSVILRDKDIFSWMFFLNRFDTLCLEAQLDLENSGDISSLQDLTSSDRKSDHFLKKINRARFALARTDSIRSVSEGLCTKPPYRRAASVPMHLLAKTLPNQQFKVKPIRPPTEVKEEKNPYTRQQSAPQFRSRGSRFGISVFSNYMFPGGHLREFTDEESNFAILLQRAMDLEGVDRETLHHLVTLLMKFMLRVDQDRVNEDRNLSKAQSTVLRHLNVLLGYNQTEKAFSVPPYKLRYSAVFNGYISALPQVLDKNFQLGNIILPVSMLLLQYSPSPQRYASDYQPPNYTLWYLEPHTRQCWLLSLLVILYKYQYNTSPASGIIQFLVRVTVNTIEAQIHQCKKREDTFENASPMVPRNRNTSNISVGDLGDILETETPPQSPPDSPGDTVTINMAPASAPSMVHYHRPVTKTSSEKTDETDLDSSSPTSKIPSPIANKTVTVVGVPPLGRASSPPLPISPTSSLPTSPVSPTPPSPAAKILNKSLPLQPHSRPSSFAFKEPKHALKPFATKATAIPETVAKRQKDQPRRIAEYNRNSLTGEESDLTLVSRAGGSGSVPPMVKQKTEPLLKYQPFQQRTLEQSAEAYLFERVGIKRTTTITTEVKEIKTDNTAGATPPNVDQKIAEQILQFESQNETKKKTGESSDETDAVVSVTSSDVGGAGAADRGEVGGASWENLHSVSQTHSHTLMLERCDKEIEVLEEVKETEEEWNSPKRILDESDTKQGGEQEKSEQTEKESQLDEKHEQTESDLDESPCTSPGSVPKFKPKFRQRKTRKTGLTTVELQQMIPELQGSMASDASSTTSSRPPRRLDVHSKSQQSLLKQIQQKSAPQSSRSTEQIPVDRCAECNAVLESYDEDTISLAITCLATFIHRESGLAAPCLLDMLQTVARIASSTPYPWQSTDVGTGMLIPGNSVSVARQFLRCALHQLAPNGIFPQLFMQDLDDDNFLKTLASALMDFAELNCNSVLQLLLEGLNEMKNIGSDQMLKVVSNLSTYLDCIALETNSPSWGVILPLFDVFFRRLLSVIPASCDIEPVLKIMISVLKIPGITSVKGLLDSFSKLLCFTVQHCAFKLQQLLDICSLSSRAFSKERDKLYLARSIIFELVQALKFKSSLPDENLILLIQFVCVDAGGTLGSVPFVPQLANYSYNPYAQSLISTNAADCLKQHLNECLEFVADLHTINKVKNNIKEGSQSLNEDTLGNYLKVGVAQFISLELTRSYSRDSPSISRFLPWLYHPPTAMQQGPREFTDCVGHIRLLAWLLIGALTHTAVTMASAPIICQPLPLEASSYIADHVMVILTGFAEQSKVSVLHMSSLFHAFIHCQLWTMYCESFASLSGPGTDVHQQAHSAIMDFWGRVTPGVLQLLSHSKVLAEMVNLHFLNLIEALQECNSLVLAKLFPMWIPILFSYHSQLPGHMQVRLQMCQNWQPRELSKDSSQLDTETLHAWLQRLQFKLGQIEVQSSAATQFYTV